jgi:hypothetical protein
MRNAHPHKNVKFVTFHLLGRQFRTCITVRLDVGNRSFHSSGFPMTQESPRFARPGSTAADVAANVACNRQCLACHLITLDASRVRLHFDCFALDVFRQIYETQSTVRASLFCLRSHAFKSTKRQPKLLFIADLNRDTQSFNVPSVYT